MSTIPADLKYVDSHEWLRTAADGIVTVGITAHAQELLGDLVFVELPTVGSVLGANDRPDRAQTPGRADASTRFGTHPG